MPEGEGGRAATVRVRAATPADLPAVVQVLSDRWGSPVILSRGSRHDASTGPALVAERAGRAVGLATYVVSGREAELLSLDALEQGEGIGSALLEAVAVAAATAGAERLVLVTTNDNLPALGFYQRRGFRLTALHAGAADRAREEKPFIPAVGLGRIPLHDELELTLDLSQDLARRPPLDPAPDRGPDPGPSRGSDPGPSRGPDPGPGRGPDPGPSRGPDPGPGRGPDPGPSRGPDPGPDTSRTRLPADPVQ